MKISFVIPARNEEGNITPLNKEIAEVAQEHKYDYEIIFVDDGSDDKTFSEMASLRARDERVKVVKLRGNWGKSLALQAAFSLVEGDVIVTLDADLQDNPHDIPRLLDKLEDGYDLVSGWKQKRRDPLTKVIPSRIYNMLVTMLTGVKLHDTNCGFKAYRREVIDNLNLYGELYRLIPVIAAKQNFRIAEVSVNHRARVRGKSKFGTERHIKGFLDLLTVAFLTGYMRRPGHFFGKLGILSFSFGFFIGIYITYLRITTGSIQNRHPLLFFGMLLMIIGVQLVTTGLLAELIVHFHSKKDTETIISKDG